MSQSPEELDQAITARYAYIDTVGFWLPCAPERKLVQRLEGHCGSINEPWTPMPYNTRWQHRLLLHQPSDRALRMAGKYFPDALINHVAPAIDYICDSEAPSKQVEKFILKHGLLRFKRKPTGKFKSSNYWANERRVANQITLYTDRPCRITGEVHCAHLEWRAQGRRTIEKLGINNFSDALEFDHRKFWQDKLILRSIEFGMMGREVRQAQGKSKRGTWLRKLPNGQCIDRDHIAGGLLARAASLENPAWPMNSTQVVRDHVKERTGVSIRRCLIPIESDSLLPAPMVISRPYTSR